MDYVLGRSSQLKQIVKPSFLLNSKNLYALPPRVVHFRLRLAKFDYTVYHVPGKLLFAADAADALSRASVPETTVDSLQEVESFVEAVMQTSLPATPRRLEEYRKAQEQDSVHPNSTVLYDRVAAEKVHILRNLSIL